MIERQNRLARARDRQYRRIVGEQDATLSGLYAQTTRLGHLVVDIARHVPTAPHRSIAGWPHKET